MGQITLPRRGESVSRALGGHCLAALRLQLLSTPKQNGHLTSGGPGEGTLWLPRQRCWGLPWCLLENEVLSCLHL